jgi:hypothetical protein
LSKENEMPVSEKPLVERVARVLAGAEVSSNAEGSDPHGGPRVNEHWRDHVNQALAVLHTMREPDEKMASEGDPETWSRMVETAICEFQQRD